MVQNACLICFRIDWNLGALKTLINKTDKTGTIDQHPGSGRPCTVHTTAVIDQVEDLALSQEEKPQTHSTRQISRQTGISLGSLNAIIKKDLQLKCLKKSKAQESVSYTHLTLPTNREV